jgi:hypothetical protein
MTYLKHNFHKSLKQKLIYLCNGTTDKHRTESAVPEMFAVSVPSIAGQELHSEF